MSAFKKLICIAPLAGAIAAVAVPAHAQTVLRLAHAAPETDLQQVLSLNFQQQVQDRSGGNIEVLVFPEGQLGNDAEMIDAVQDGHIDIVMSGLNNFTGMVPEAGAFMLPFLFPDRQTAYAVLDGDVGQRVWASLETSGMHGLGFPENGFRNITTNRGFVQEPADLVGLSMRVNNSVVLNDMFSLLGADTQQIPVGELFAALENGVVDAQDHPIGIVLSFRFYEVQEYLTLTRHSYAPLALVMNADAYNALSGEEQQIVTSAAAEAIELQRELSIAAEEALIAQLVSAGMQVSDDVDVEAFQDAVAPAWDNFIAANGDDLINAILSVSD